MTDTYAPAAGRPRGDHDARRQEVVEATWRVIHRSGIDKASLRAIAREAGFTTGVITHYFADKEELLAFAVATIFEWIRERTEQLAEAEDVIAALRTLYDAALPVDEARRLQWSVWLAFLSRARHNPAYADAILSWHSSFRRRLEGLMARGQEAGSIRRDVPAAVLADQFNAALDGLALMAPFERDRFPPAYLRALMELAIGNLTPTTAAGQAPGEQRP
jgi:AcrR family transcriptional regulator